jgi:hypothetical protein
MFKNCFFPKKKVEKVVAPSDVNILTLGPITALRAQKDASKIRKRAQKEHDRFLNEIVIPRIWELIHSAKSQRDYAMSFDDNYFRPRITHEDFPFISQHFENPQYKFKVQKELYNNNSSATDRPDFCIEFYWDKEFDENSTFHK